MFTGELNKMRCVAVAISLACISLLTTAGVGFSAKSRQIDKKGLDPRISQPDPKKYKDIRDGSDWQNPYVIVQADGVLLNCNAVHFGQKAVRLDGLRRVLISLPVSAWPYGGVVAVQEAGVRGLDDDALITRNKATVEGILKSLALKVEWRPSG